MDNPPYELSLSRGLDRAAARSHMGKGGIGLVQCRPADMKAEGDAVRKGNSAKPVAVMLDTCVWLDLAQPINEPLLAALEQIVHLKDIELMVPQIVRDSSPAISRGSSRTAVGASLLRSSERVVPCRRTRTRGSARRPSMS